MPHSDKVAFVSAVIALGSPAHAAQSQRPPTLDPTYGLPVHFARVRSGPIARASWIWADTTTDEQVVYVRRKVSLRSKPSRAFLYLTVDNYFTLFVNEKQVDQTEPAPGVSTEGVWQHVHRIDVAPYLVSGTNVIAIRAQNAGGPAGVLARLEIPGMPPLQSDLSWRVMTASSAPDGWMGSSFDESGWKPATPVAPVGEGPWGNSGELQSWPGADVSVPYLAHITLPVVRAELVDGSAAILGLDTLTARDGVHLTVDPSAAAADGHAPAILLDFGKELAGRVQISGTGDAQVQIATGESREECLQQPWGGPHLIALDDHGNGASPYSAFRFAKLTFVGKAPCTLTNVSLDHKYYPVRYLGSFNCSDPLLTTVWYTGAYTAHLCMQEDIWDAPKRDRARWIGDLHVSGKVIDNVFADRFLMEQTLQRLRADAQGGRPGTELPGSEVNGIPGYSAAWFCTLADLYRQIGDVDFVRSQHDNIVSLLRYQQGDFDSNNLFVNPRHSWPFVDWSPGFDGDTPLARAATQMFIIKGVREAVYLLRELGDTQNADTYGAWADSLTAAARASLPDARMQTYGDRRQENAMAVYSGVATAEQAGPIYDRVLNPASPSWQQMATPYYNNYVIFALAMMGHTPDALSFIRSYWGGMLAEGATSFWEGYDLSWPKENYHAHLQADDGTGFFVSLCHGWSAGCTNFLTEQVLGIRSTGAGFKTADITPDLVDLTWAEGAVPTPRGLLRVRAEKTAGGTTLRVKLPRGVEAHIGIPGGSIRLNGRPASGASTVNGRTFVTVRGGGTYTLTSN